MLITRHAKKRMRQRAVSRARVWRGLRARKKHQGRDIYRSEVENPNSTTVVVYKKRGGKRVILSTWKKYRS